MHPTPYVSPYVSPRSVALLELDGLSPYVYSNLNGLMERDEHGVVVHALVEPGRIVDATGPAEMAR